MNKYISPKIEISKIEVEDVIATSGSGVTIAALNGVDSEDSKSAIFNALFWF